MDLSLLDFLIKEDSILLKQNAADWKEAISLSCKPLINSKAIDEIYIDKIIDSVEKNGPYFIIAENFAMPHAEAGDWIKRNAFSLVTLNEPIYFKNDSRKISLLVCLASKNSKFHMSVALPQIVAAFENNETIDEILSAKTKEEVIAIISKINLKKYII